MNIYDFFRKYVPETERVTEICKTKLYKIMRDFIIGTVHAKNYGNKTKKVKW
jgi:hypothetical protein